MKAVKSKVSGVVELVRDSHADLLVYGHGSHEYCSRKEYRLFIGKPNASDKTEVVKEKLL